jgi:hypothetical protein
MKNHLVCLSCNTILQAPAREGGKNSCNCSNKAWIQKLSHPTCWSYGGLDPQALQRVKEKEKAA